MKNITANEMVQKILSWPEYKGKAYLGLTAIARIFFNGNSDRAKAFINDKSIPFYLECYGSGTGKGHKMYNIYEVQEAVNGTRWEKGA